MTKEQEMLCLHNMRLVSHCASKFQSTGIPWEELCASGNLGLVQAAASFLPEKNTRFSTYACICICNEIYLLLRQRRKHSKVTESLDDELAYTEGLRLHDVLPDEMDMASMVESRILASDAAARIKQLPCKLRKICELRFGLSGMPPLNQRDIAKHLGCSRSLISRRLKESLTILRYEV